MIDIISFTDRGAALSFRLRDGLSEPVRLFSKHRFPDIRDRGVTFVPGSLREWAGERFRQRIPMVFIGAAGIAVRAIAPCVADKTEDPPVVVVDERGQYVIPLLSAHFGGGSDLSDKIARLLGALNVNTTATDVNGLFAVDSFAGRNSLAFEEKKAFLDIATALLSGERLSIRIDGAFSGEIPPELILKKDGEEADIVISVFSPSAAGTERLRLYPRSVHVGIGCRAGKSGEEIGAVVNRFLKEAGISPLAVCRAATIDKKEHEEGLVRFCASRGWPLTAFTARELMEVEGDFRSSSFVQEVTGADNVCERAAMASALCASGRSALSGQALILPKRAENAVTVAAVEEPWEVSFGE